MNRFAVIVAMLIVVTGVSVASSFSTAASLAFATALVASAMLVHEFAFRVETTGVGTDPVLERPGIPGTGPGSHDSLRHRRGCDCLDGGIAAVVRRLNLLFFLGGAGADYFG